jgi:Lon protease-like protein
MFPLGTVLFPSALLPLHVFEPRYRVMTRHCLDTEPEFGVVLIERGSEVGGGDVRTDVGTVARIIEARELPDGRWVMTAVGVRRIRVTRWLTDDPYPRAEVEDFADPPGDSAEDDAGDQYPRVVAALRRVLALRAELGEPAAAATIELSAESGLGSFQVAATAPIGPADQQRVLATPTAAERLALMAHFLADEARFLERRLGTP